MKKNLKSLMRAAVVVLSTALAVGVTASAAVGCKDNKPARDGTSVVNKSSGNVYYIGTPEQGATQDGKSEATCYNIREFFTNYQANLQPGDVVKVCPGEHIVDIPVDTEQDIQDGNTHDKKLTITRSGTYDNYIIYEPADISKKTVLNFKNQLFLSTARGVQMDANYIYWHDIDICGAGDNGMYIGGNYNIVENCEFYNNRDTGLQLGRSQSSYSNINQWPSYNLIKNCTSYNNYDNETAGENADGFAAKLTVGYGNIFDGCIAYRNSDDGWDLYGKPDSGNIGCVIIYNCVAFENGFLMDTQKNCNDWYGESYNHEMDEINTASFTTKDGDGNGFKLGGSTMAGDVKLYNCLAFNNRMHGVTDNSNPGVIAIDSITSYNNGAVIDTRSHLDIVDVNGNKSNYYHAISSSGYITRADGNNVVIDEAGNTGDPDSYNTVDKDGWILKVDNTFFLNNGNKVKGFNVKAAESGQTVNPDFGKITTGSNGSDYGNINLARTADSYNAMKNVLSVNNGSQSLISDEYKGAADSSIFTKNGTKSYKIDSPIDASLVADSDITGKCGEIIDAPAATDIFEELPANDLGFRNDIHTAWRNADHSVNLGNILKIKDYSKLLGEDKKIGCDLTKSGWGDYKHFNYTYLTSNSITSADEAQFAAIKNLLYYPGDDNAVFQDFNLVAEMLKSTIEWTSSDPDVISIGTEVTSILPCESKIVRAIVNRPTGGDKVVTLTAKITLPSGAVSTHDIQVNVKRSALEIGNIIIDGVTPDGYVILYTYKDTQPSFEITNASDYNGKLLDKASYEVTTTAKYGEDKSSELTDLSADMLDTFIRTTPGVYEITKSITLGTQEKSFTYFVYVVSRDGEIDFMPDADIVNATHDGYMISGELSNVSGTLYTMVADSKPDAAKLKAEGEAYEITKDNISASFKHDISKGFKVYYGIYNPNGKLTSDIYEKSIDIVNIGTNAEFKNLVKTGGEANKIYKLTNDLDFTGDTIAVADAAFGGVLDGCGHTISNVTIYNPSSKKGLVSIFYKLDGGSIINVNFDHISLDGKEDVGIIGQAYSGYIANVKMTEIRATGATRIGGLIGHAYEQSTTPLIIERVSLVNTESESVIYATDTKAGRVAGILGFIQTNSTDTLNSLKVDIKIKNCYVDARIGDPKSQQCSGIVGTYDTSTQAKTKGFTYSMTIDSCYFVGTVYGNDRVSGIISYQQGLGTLRVSNCVSVGHFFFKGREINVAEKNSSCIFGGYVSTADTRVSNCWGLYSDHNSFYDVSPVSRTGLTESFWKNYTSFDLENIWEYTDLTIRLR